MDSTAGYRVGREAIVDTKIPGKNPFRIGDPVQEPSDFGGRKEILEKIIYHIRNLQSVSLRGERRIGKTSLLLCLADVAFLEALGLPEDHIAVYFDFQAVAGAGEARVWEAIANAIAKRIKQAPGGEAESEKFLKTIKKDFASESYAGGIGTALIGLADYKIHLLFDEFEETVNYPKWKNSFYKALRSLIIRGKNISYVIATRTGLAALQPEYDEFSSPFFNIFTSITLPLFQEDEVRELIFVYFRRAGFNISLAIKLCDDLPFLYDITGYHPFFLQAFCYHLCMELDSPDWPSGQSRQKALNAFERDTEEHFEYYWKVSSEKECSFIKKIAAKQAVNWNDLKVQAVINQLKARCLVLPVNEQKNTCKLFSVIFEKWVNQQDAISSRAVHLGHDILIPSVPTGMSLIKRKSFSWLHLTDLYVGKDQKPLLHRKDLFFKDLGGLYEKCGPWDVILITGDITDTGNILEFQQAGKILKELQVHIGELAQEQNVLHLPPVLVVPGERDLVRPKNKNAPQVLILHQWTHQDNWIHRSVAPRDFWRNEKSSYRKEIDKAFQYYTVWRKKSDLKAVVKPGILPGDFSASFNKNGCKIGIVGLNTAFLHLTDEKNYKGRLVLDVKQFHGACDDDGVDWANQHHVCLLMTHHPPEWLTEKAQQSLQQEIVADRRFMIHLCGHFHRSSEKAFTKHEQTGNKPPYIIRGKPLFKGDEHQFGYSAGKIEWDEKRDKGRLVLYPRTGHGQGDRINFVPDTSFHLTDGLHTVPEEFDLPEFTGQTPENGERENLFVFVNVAPEDKEYAGTILELLQENQIDYSLPMEESTPVSATEKRLDLEYNLVSCNAIILVRENASIEWLRGQLQQCKRIRSQRGGNELKIIVLMKSPAPLNIHLRGMEILDCSILENGNCLSRIMEALRS